MAQVNSMDVAFSPAVKAVQTAKGSREGYARLETRRPWPNRITPELADFIGQQTGFFLGTASAGGQPYIQHRGGPPGFLKVLGEARLGFADLSGNRQYITLGNLSENSSAILFLIDFEHARRVKRIMETPASVPEAFSVDEAAVRDYHERILEWYERWLKAPAAATDEGR